MGCLKKIKIKIKNGGINRLNDSIFIKCINYSNNNDVNLFLLKERYNHLLAEYSSVYIYKNKSHSFYLYFQLISFFRDPIPSPIRFLNKETLFIPK